MKYKLMIKQHTITKLKYLCVTERNDYIKYCGSGKYWLRHLRKHGFFFDTVLLCDTDDINLHTDKCNKYSKKFDIVNSNDWANLIPELGCDKNSGNLNYWWKNQPEEIIHSIHKKRQITLQATYDNRTPEQIRQRSNIFKRIAHISYNTRLQNICNKLNIDINNITYDQQKIVNKELTYKANIGRYNWFNNLTETELVNFKQNLSKVQVKKFENFCDEDWKLFSERISYGRLNMSPEDKQKRSKNFALNFQRDKNGKFLNSKVAANIKKQKEKRRDGGNPAARICVVYGIEYSCKRKAIKETNLTPGQLEKLLNSHKQTDCYEVNPFKRNYEEVQCLYCNKIGLNTSSFKRWHFNNCKNRKKSYENCIN